MHATHLSSVVAAVSRSSAGDSSCGYACVGSTADQGCSMGCSMGVCIQKASRCVGAGPLCCSAGTLHWYALPSRVLVRAPGAGSLRESCTMAAAATARGSLASP